MNEEMKLTNFSVDYQFANKTIKLSSGKSEANIKIRDETNIKLDLSVEGEKSDVLVIPGPREYVMKAKKRLLEISIEKQFVGHTAEIKANPEQHNF
ncbi:hypothetical protein NPIL_25941 [Nephila pilipes]|uniref:Vigilin N-terminal KH domain-containing protein n=1 Tax=Nephila pilipes TaxID=299642 RepID=A0A8X6T3H9_NEPPI|nr:hypothetical protein NPIL_25941 [Nephila pilipes]